MFSAIQVTLIEHLTCAVARLTSTDGETVTYGFVVNGKNIYFLLTEYDTCENGIIEHRDKRFRQYTPIRKEVQNAVIVIVSNVTYKIFS